VSQPSHKLPVAIVASIVVLIGGAICWHMSHSREHVAANVDGPDAALAELRRGNNRFVNCSRTHSTDTGHDDALRRETAKGQHPFAAIVCCADSRVCPEFIFDQAVGTIFEVRNAGNVADDDVLASLEYAVEHLHVPLIVILGHRGCGAIEAVCAAGEEPLHDHLKELQKQTAGIRQQVLEGHHRHDAEIVNRLSLENARQQALTVLRESPEIKAAVDRGEVRIVYAIYDMESGAVEFFDLGGSR
jgi:carbonic anhydrase